MCDKRIAYIYDDNLKHQCNRIPSVLDRASVVQDLINSYNILDDDNSVAIVHSSQASEEELKLFHSSDYLDFVRKTNSYDESCLELVENEQLEFGLGYDCPLLEHTYDFMRTIAGGTLTAAKLLNSSSCEIAINWFGGWHHAQRDSAEGFCYVNDVVLGIQKLTEMFSRILYLDLDIHHGNGVQNAFELSKKVLTLSFHKFLPGFYPGTGGIHDNGFLKGKGYSINVPFLEGVSHKSFRRTFQIILPRVMEVYQPGALVVQCGADGLNEDPLGQSNLTLDTFGECLTEILDYSLPTLLLGGGGYNFANTARLWAYLTSLVLNKSLDDDIPDVSNYFMEYRPSFELKIVAGNQYDKNSEEYLKFIIKSVLEQCSNISMD